MPTTIVDANGGESGEQPPDGELRSGSYALQPAFDPSSRLPVGALISRARRDLAEAERSLDAADAVMRDTDRALGLLREKRTVLDVETRRNVDEAASARRTVAERAADAYVRGDTVSAAFTVLRDPAEGSVAVQYLLSVREADERAIDALGVARGRLDEQADALAESLASAGAALDARRSERDRAAALVADRQLAVTVFEAGSRLHVSGFVFPVRGPTTFDDSFGNARMPGSPHAHWHEGTDIMAAAGAELVACETGVVDRVSDNALGGLSLWITGVSGTHYYYAHLSAYAPGVAVGTFVVAGTVVGLAGATGNAAGGSPHLHFEVHPQGGAPVDPYALLKTTLEREQAMAHGPGTQPGGAGT